MLSYLMCGIVVKIYVYIRSKFWYQFSTFVSLSVWVRGSFPHVSVNVVYHSQSHEEAWWGTGWDPRWSSKCHVPTWPLNQTYWSASLLAIQTRTKVRSTSQTPTDCSVGHSEKLLWGFNVTETPLWGRGGLLLIDLLAHRKCSIIHYFCSRWVVWSL